MFQIAPDSVPMGTPEMEQDLRSPGVSGQLLCWSAIRTNSFPVSAVDSRSTAKFVPAAIPSAVSRGAHLSV